MEAGGLFLPMVLAPESHRVGFIKRTLVWSVIFPSGLTPDLKPLLGNYELNAGMVNISPLHNHSNQVVIAPRAVL